MLSHIDGHLLTYASSKLNPDVFFHPVWVRFGNRKSLISFKFTDNLLGTAKSLIVKDPRSACQVFFLCAAYQSHAGWHENSLSTIHQALLLAEKSGFSSEVVWSKWGKSAIYIQQGDYKKASSQLGELQKVLAKQNDWMLADFIDIVKQSVNQPIKPSTRITTEFPQNQTADDMLHTTMDWLQNWGIPMNGTNSNFENASKHTTGRTASTPISVPFIHSLNRWKKFLQNLLHQVESNFKPGQGKKNKKHHSDHKSGVQKSDDDPLPPESSIVDSTHDKHPSNIFSSNLETPVLIKQDTDQLSHSNTIVAQMLGPFSIIIQDSPLILSTSRGLSVLKYLLLNHKQDTPREVLMDTFWPDTSPEAARNNLNVAMCSLRRALRTATDLTVIRFKYGAYGLSRNFDLWLDVDEFERCVKAGQNLETQNRLTDAVIEYEIAINLYQGDFLADHIYEGWTTLERERLRIAYLDTLDRLSQIYFNQEQYGPCANLCQLILNRDLCREDAQCRLMRCYSRQGQDYLALRQYQACVDALRLELDVAPAPETTRLYEKIRQHQLV